MLKRIANAVINGLLLLRAYALWAVALVLLSTGYAFAQDVGLIPGVPAELQTIITVGLGLLSAALIGPATAIAKKLGRTSGPTTVGVSAVLSLAVAIGFALIQAATTRGEIAWTAALWIALLGFIRSNGAYISAVFAQIKGTTAAPAPLPPTDPALPSGFEPLESLPAGFEPEDHSAAPPLALLSVASFNGFGGPIAEAALSATLSWVLGQLHLPATAENIARLAFRLGKVVPDLLDGDKHLNWRNRAEILDVAQELLSAGGFRL